jgi:serine/threonine-protein phosphatase 5
MIFSAYKIHINFFYYFPEGNYDQAIDEYTKAIALKLNSPKSAVYFANRAFAHMKLENYGLAIADCEDSIKLDPNYAKAYYRKADANIALNKYEIARDCLKKVFINFNSING